MYVTVFAFFTYLLLLTSTGTHERTPRSTVKGHTHTHYLRSKTGRGGLGGFRLSLGVASLEHVGDLAACEEASAADPPERRVAQAGRAAVGGSQRTLRAEWRAERLLG